MRILIVDDEDVLQDVLTSLLQGEGYETVSARTGAEALEHLGREEVDLVLLDLMLPGIDGLEVAKRLNSMGATREDLLKIEGLNRII